MEFYGVLYRRLYIDLGRDIGSSIEEPIEGHVIMQKLTIDVQKISRVIDNRSNLNAVIADIENRRRALKCHVSADEILNLDLILRDLKNTLADL